MILTHLGSLFTRWIIFTYSTWIRRDICMWKNSTVLLTPWSQAQQHHWHRVEKMFSLTLREKIANLNRKFNEMFATVISLIQRYFLLISHFCGCHWHRGEVFVLTSKYFLRESRVNKKYIAEHLYSRTKKFKFQTVGFLIKPESLPLRYQRHHGVKNSNF